MDEKMSNAAFWLALLDMGQDVDQQARLWNGYLGWKLPPDIKGEREDAGGWPQWFIPPPNGRWPKLTDEEKGIIESFAEQYGGHPEYGPGYMDFSHCVFAEKLDLFGCILTWANFNWATFKSEARLSGTRFYAPSLFREAVFEGSFHCSGTWFEADVNFSGSRFKELAWIRGAEFMGGASFASTVFKEQANFDESRFDEMRFNRGLGHVPMSLVNFKGAEFRSVASFREVLFGNDDTTYKERFPERKADFTDAKFMATTDFHGAVFWGVPAFFNTTLHEDTDFSRVDWKRAENDNIQVNYAIRAWERLELMMSKLEKPLDRHRFFRHKMRVRRRVDSPLLKVINWLFEKIADYGWGVGRACAWWFGHWVLSAVILFMNACPSVSSANLGKFVLASIGTGFANAHAFLFLTTRGGYLEESRSLLESNDAWGLVTGVGIVEAILGPIFLFLMLLTLQKRFRLA